MVCTVLLGTQWGDEGKGKITDLLSRDHDAVVRFQGGNNAGHTIVVGGVKFKLHLVPSGVIRGGIASVIGDGCVVDPWVLEKELRDLELRGISTANVVLSDRAHLIMPYHRELDRVQETSRAGSSKVGTTGRGIGPCYQDKMGRTGIRASDLRYPPLLEEKVRKGCRDAAAICGALGSPVTFDPAVILRELHELGEVLVPRVRDAPALLNDMMDKGARVLLEGAQGTFLDIDRGTYPFVTSSSCSTGNASAGSGIGPSWFERVIGVVKAYTTRVGEGPFPTELTDHVGEMMRDVGCEFGTTTNRPRRCGWLDLVLVRSSVKWNSIDDLALTKTDVLSSLKEVLVCTEYSIPREAAERCGLPTVIRDFPSHLELLKECRPVYRKLKGWGELSKEEWEACRAEGTLPPGLDGYVSLIEREVLAAVTLVSYGPGRDETIELGGS
jgi:adenylosuccinate synthase